MVLRRKRIRWTIPIRGFPRALGGRRITSGKRSGKRSAGFLSSRLRKKQESGLKTETTRFPPASLLLPFPLEIVKRCRANLIYLRQNQEKFYRASSRPCVST